jgi:hypothetical protein
MDTHSWVLWLGIIAVGLHVMEEYAEGWLVWANQQVGPRFGVTFTQADFFFAAFLLIFYALAGAAIGWWAPAVSLAVPALFIVNAVFLHMIPSARGDRLTPGTLSAVFIYLPVAAWMFWAAAEDDVLSFGTIVLAFLLGTALMYYPLAVAVLARKIGWQEGQGETTAAPTESTASGSTEADQAEADQAEAGRPDRASTESDRPDQASAETGRREAEPADPAAEETEEPAVEASEPVVEPQTIVIEPDPEDDDTTILDRDREDPPHPT